MQSFPKPGLFLVALLALTAGCAREVIPNTDVEDTGENRDIVAFVEKYRHAVEARDVAQLLSMASPRYFDDNGTPSGNDDLDFGGLRAKLARWREAVLDVRYEIRYRRVMQQGDKVLVDFTYTGSFRVMTPDGERWARRLADNRLVLARGGADGELKILSGM